jgi:hypothetical protein
MKRLEAFRTRKGIALKTVVAGLVLGAALEVCMAPQAMAGQLLITADESARPTPPGSTPVAARGITRGPKITLLSPAAGASAASPIDLKLKFESFGGTSIDPNSLHVTYLKTPAVDLTDRVKSFAQSGGLEMPQAELPPGDHVIKVELTDSDGHVATSTFMLKVAQ